MEILFKGTWEGLKLIFGGDAEIWQIVWVSVRVGLGGVFLATLFGMPLGLLLALKKFRGRRLCVLIVNTLVAIPTVVVGLLFFCLLSRTIGLLSFLDLLYTVPGMILALGFLGTPLVASMVNASVRGVDPAVYMAALTLGATPVQASIRIVIEAWYGIVAALIICFGRLISEVGIAAMIGGNIRHSTRTMTTYIALETEKGEFEYAIALGIVLMVVVIVLNVLFMLLQGRRQA
jgi:tungstate transport system permease protein